LNAVLNELLLTQRDQLAEKNAVVKSESLPTVVGIRFQLYQLLENLIGNAIKYAREGVAPRINVTYALVDGSNVDDSDALHDRCYHRISVSDNGIGFEQKHAGKIFEVFQRLHQRDQYPGTGIGLAICKRIVENHGGFITATSDPGKGSTFNAYLAAETKKK
jgi:signal transduction histidine kinase